MGKKRVAQKTKEELLLEREKLNQALKKESGVKKGGTDEGKIFISSSYNNTLLTLADSAGNVLGWASAGSLGFKGTKKATPFAASKVTEVLVQKAQKEGITSVAVFVKGIGGGRDSSLKALASQGIDIISIKDVTPMPHNGCRPRRPRRV